MIRLYTERLLIRDHVWIDLPTHHALLSDPVAMRYLPDIHTQTLEESKANLQSAIEQIDAEPRICYFFRIEDKINGEFIGEIGYTVTEFAPQGKCVGLGYFINKVHWGCGYTTEACKEVLRFAFEEGGVYRVSTGCLAENAASERVMRKCGMIKEAEFKEYQLHEGILKDRVEYRLLRSEWAHEGC